MPTSISTLMCRSALVLGPSFEAMAAAAAVGRRLHADAARDPRPASGATPRRTMMAATGGVNTHRGAIWALGLLVAAAALVAVGPGAGTPTPRRLRRRRARSRVAPIGSRRRRPGTRASTPVAIYRVGGARGQAFAGFPQVVGRGLPALRSSRIARRSRALGTVECPAGDRRHAGRHLRAGARRSAGAAPDAARRGCRTRRWRRGDAGRAAALRDLDGWALAHAACPPAEQPTCSPPRCSSIGWTKATARAAARPGH